MKKVLNPGAVVVLVVLVHLLGLNVRTVAQSTAFTYQGRLTDGASPANGVYDLSFTLYDAEIQGSIIAGPLLTTRIPVSNGLFSVTLQFGATTFNGADRWLAIGVRNNGSAAEFTAVQPRQPLRATPYAIRAANFSGSVAATQLTGTIPSNNIAAASITTAMLAPGAVGSAQLASGSVTTTALANNAVTAAKIASLTNWSMLTIPGPLGTNQFFGSSVAALGDDRLLIGALGNDTGAINAGAAYLFRIDGTLLTTFTNPVPTSNDVFGSEVAAVGNDRVLIGAQGGVFASKFGAAYLFSASGALLTTFTNPIPAPDDYFGSSLAAVGDNHVLIGALGSDIGDFNSGIAYLFTTQGKLVTTFTNPTPAAGDAFGNGLAALGKDRVLISAFLDDSGQDSAGVAYLFNTNGALLTTFNDPVPTRTGRFGNAVAAVGNDRLLIGAPGHRLGNTFPIPGLAYLFDTNGSVLTTFTNPVPAIIGNFGHAVAAVGNDQVLIGGATPPVAHLFGTDGTLLATFTNPAPALGGGIGRPLAAVGQHLVMPAFFGDTAAVNVGAVYVFTSETYAAGFFAEGVRTGSITTESLEDGSVTAEKIGGVLLKSQIPNLDASKITTGVFSDARLSPNVSLAGKSIESDEIADGTILDADIHPAAGILDTKLATISAAGKVADTALSTNVARRSGGNIFGGDQVFTGSIGLGSLQPDAPISASSGARLTEGGIWSNACDTNRLTDFRSVDAQALLRKVIALPVREWRYTDDPVDVKHVGPTAQDFRAAFGLGSDDKTIGTLDENGVTLAAVQGLDQKLSSDVTALRAENLALKLRLEKLEELVKRLLDENGQ